MALFIRLLGLALMLVALAVPLLRAPDRAVETLVGRWAPPPSEFMDLGGQLVHYRDEGPRNDAMPIVLLHGTSASLHTWEGWAKALRGQHRVIRLDLPAFGLTGPFAGPYAGRAYNGTEYARFVLDVLAVYADPAKVNDALVDRYFELTLRAGNRAALVQRAQSWSRGEGVAHVTGVVAPTLILWGGRDRIIAPANAQRFAADIAGSQVQLFDDLGHVPQEEDPARTVAAVQAFLAALPVPAQARALSMRE